MPLTKIHTHTNRETVEALEELLRLARAKKLNGVMFGCWFDKPHHQIWVTGEYLDDPVQALAVSARMYAVANGMINDYDAGHGNSVPRIENGQ